MNIYSLDINGDTLLHKAVSINKNIENLKYLLNLGLSVHALNKYN